MFDEGRMEFEAEMKKAAEDSRLVVVMTLSVNGF